MENREKKTKVKLKINLEIDVDFEVPKDPAEVSILSLVVSKNDITSLLSDSIRNYRFLESVNNSKSFKINSIKTGSAKTEIII